MKKLSAILIVSILFLSCTKEGISIGKKIVRYDVSTSRGKLAMISFLDANGHQVTRQNTMLSKYTISFDVNSRGEHPLAIGAASNIGDLPLPLISLKIYVDGRVVAQSTSGGGAFVSYTLK